MVGRAEDAAKPSQIMATLLLERQTPIDYQLMTERVGSMLGLDAANIGDTTPGAPMVLPVDGDIVFGLNMDLPYPDTLQQLARFAYWWPNALSDLSRHRAHLMVSCQWTKFSRLDAHMRHLVLMRELIGPSVVTRDGRILPPPPEMPPTPPETKPATADTVAGAPGYIAGACSLPGLATHPSCRHGPWPAVQACFWARARRAA